MTHGGRHKGELFYVCEGGDVSGGSDGDDFCFCLGGHFDVFLGGILIVDVCGGKSRFQAEEMEAAGSSLLRPSDGRSVVHRGRRNKSKLAERHEIRGLQCMNISMNDGVDRRTKTLSNSTCTKFFSRPQLHARPGQARNFIPTTPDETCSAGLGLGPRGPTLVSLHLDPTRAM